MSVRVEPPPQVEGGAVDALDRIMTPRDRKTVPLPGSLPELQQSAALHFNHGGHLRLYHEGRELHHGGAVADLMPNAIVKVRLDRGLRAPGGTIDTISTHRSDYVKHPPYEQLKAMGSDDQSILTELSHGKRLEGESRYKTDYSVPDPSGRARQDKVANRISSVFRHGNVPTGMTAYQSEFPWRDIRADDNGKLDDKSVLSKAALGKKFTARTVYEEDFLKRGETVVPERPLVNDSTSTLTEATKRASFEGATTYGGHFIKHVDIGRQPNCRPPNKGPGKRLFGGNSEYGRQYNGSKMTPMHYVHLEPESSGPWSAR